MDEHEHWMLEWFRKAEHDRDAAYRALKDRPLSDVAYFHAQQCVEKYLKGFLTAHGEEVEKTHDLLKLLEDCSRIESAFNQQLYDDCKALNVYSVEICYPGLPDEPDEAEARAAVKRAGQARSFIRSILDL